MRAGPGRRFESIGNMNFERPPYREKLVRLVSLPLFKSKKCSKLGRYYTDMIDSKVRRKR